MLVEPMDDNVMLWGDVYESGWGLAMGESGASSSNVHPMLSPSSIHPVVHKMSNPMLFEFETERYDVDTSDWGARIKEEGKEKVLMLSFQKLLTERLPDESKTIPWGL